MVMISITIISIPNGQSHLGLKLGVRKQFLVRFSILDKAKNEIIRTFELCHHYAKATTFNDFWILRLDLRSKY